MRIKSSGVRALRMPRQSISTVVGFRLRTRAPICCKISSWMMTSLTRGTFSIRHTPLTMIVAGMMATTAFFAPLTVTSPCSGLFPLMINLSKVLILPSSVFWLFRFRQA